MSVAVVYSRACMGMDAPLVSVEVHVSNGLPRTAIVGMPAKCVKESCDRVRSALISSGFSYPPRRITVSLAPAELPKDGSRFDLPIALGILIASKQLQVTDLDRYCFVGELSLSGGVRSVKGIIPFVLESKKHGSEIIVPRSNAEQAALCEGIVIRPARHIIEVCQHFQKKNILEPWVSNEERMKSGEEEVSIGDVILKNNKEKDGNGGKSGEDGRVEKYGSGGKNENGGKNEKNGMSGKSDNNVNDKRKSLYAYDLQDIKGQLQAKRALEIAAAGRHHLIMMGPPGSGKSMLAKRLITILPLLQKKEALECMAIQSLFNKQSDSLVLQRPFRSPHHSASAVALVGGSSPPKPGEISLAHHGVLFLDELPEFQRSVLESLREPIESGCITISRASYQMSYPCRFQCIAAMNPCPCGYVGDGTDRCHCNPQQIQRYVSKISGPLLDRFDIHVEVGSISEEELLHSQLAESSHTVLQRVEEAHNMQLQRGFGNNANLTDSQCQVVCCLNQSDHRYLIKAMRKWHLSMRCYQKVIKVARTIADLVQSKVIDREHVQEALSYRLLDKWYK